MTKMQVTISPVGLPPHTLAGHAPSADSPLVITRTCRWTGSHWEDLDRWQIVHVPTGRNLGRRSWRTRRAALAVLARCRSDFPCWRTATGSKADPATVECFELFRAALS